ncbi:hypothetical protein BsWGS_02292 [Bradybaena similaris]
MTSVSRHSHIYYIWGNQLVANSFKLISAANQTEECSSTSAVKDCPVIDFAIYHPQPASLKSPSMTCWRMHWVISSHLDCMGHLFPSGLYGSSLPIWTVWVISSRLDYGSSLPIGTVWVISSHLDCSPGLFPNHYGCISLY